jgi:hypothetical protein
VAQQSWPSPAHNSRAVTDSEYEVLTARSVYSGVVGHPQDAAVVSAGTGLTVVVRNNVYGNVRGFAWYSGTTDETLPIAANSSGSTRIDRVVLRLDRSNWTVRPAVKPGTPGSGTPPSLTTDGIGVGVYEITLARVIVPTGATSVTVTREELYIGSRIRACTSTTRPVGVTVLGEVCYETDTGCLRVWTGTAWSLVHSPRRAVDCDADLEAWDILSESELEARSGIVCLRLGSWERAAGTLSAETPSRLPVLIPAAYRHPDRDQTVIFYVSGAEIGRGIIYSAASDKAGQVWITNKPAIATGVRLNAQSGISWVAD